jgi:tyrosine-protein kinase Etk/Wzc
MIRKSHAHETEPRGADELTLASIIDTLVNRRIMIAVTTAVVIVLGAVYAFFSAPVYRSEILIKVEDTSGVPGPDGRGLLSNVSPMFDQKSSAEGEMQVARSKAVMSRTVDALKLYIDAKPHYFPLIGAWIARHSDKLSTPGLFGMGGFAWGNEAIEVTDFDVPRRQEEAGYTVTAGSGGEYVLMGPGLAKPVTGRVGVTESFPTARGNMKLHVKGITGASGTEFNLMRHSRLLTIDALQTRLQIVEQGMKSNVFSVKLEGDDPVRVSATLNEIGNEYLKENAASKSLIKEKSLTFLNRELPLAKERMQKAEIAYNQYRNTHSMLDLGEQSRLVLAQTVTANSQLLELQRKRQELSALYSPNHPSVMAVDQQIASTKNYLDVLTERTKAMPSEEQGVLGLTRDMRVNTELYTAMLRNIDELKLIEAGKVNSVQLIDIADVPERPVRPIKSLVLVLSAALGLLLGVGLAFARDILFKGLTDPQELESLTGLSVYATIPVSERQQQLAERIEARAPGQWVLAAQYPKDPAVESLRMLRSALQFAMIGARNNVVVLAGPLPGIGKSFLSVNLATLLAAGGKRVLLIDGDLRKGRLNQYLDLTRGPGLVDILDGSRSIDTALHEEVLPNLDFIATGAYPANPAELLLRDGFKEMMREASSRYDIVLLDAPAILAVSDAGIMAPVAGSVFLIARFGDTRAGEIAESVKRLAQTGTRVSGVLFNGFRVHGGAYSDSRRYGNYAYVAHRYESSTE